MDVTGWRLEGRVRTEAQDDPILVLRPLSDERPHRLVEVGIQLEGALLHPARVRDEHDGDLLHWFYDNGFAPGATVLRQVSDKSGPLPVELDGAARTIDEKYAEGLYVRPAA